MPLLKTILVLLVMLFLISTEIGAQYATFSGKITQPTSDEFSISIYYYGDEELTEFKGSVDEEGLFKMDVDLQFAGKYSFRHGVESSTFFLSPGYNIHLTIDTKEFDESLSYSGDGAAGSNFLAAHFLQFEDDEKDLGRKQFTRIKSDSPGEYLEFIDSLKAERLHLLETFRQDMDSATYAFLEADILYDGLVNKLEYPMFHGYLNNLDGNVEVPDNYYDFLKEHTLISDQFINLNSYKRFLSAYVEHVLRKIIIDAGINFENFAIKKYHLLNVLLSGDLGDQMKAAQLKSTFRVADYKSTMVILEHFKMTTPGYDRMHELDKVASTYEKLSPGNIPPAIQLSTLEGEPFDLYQHHGKVVYIDFWASWCGPCISEFPSAKKIKEAFQEEDVVFLYVSIDESEEAWKKAIEKHQIEGIHVWSQGFSSEIPKAYGVRGIPSYFLIGKDGKMLDNKAPRPSSSTLSNVLMDALK